MRWVVADRDSDVSPIPMTRDDEARLRLNRRFGPTPQRLPINHQGAFGDGLRRAFAGRAELQFFAYLATELEPLLQAVPRLKPLRDSYGLYADYTDGEAVRLYFGRRPLYRRAVGCTSGVLLTETGPQLIYSVGPGGDIAVMLVGAESKLSGPLEEGIFLRVGRFGGGQLYEHLKRDLKDLATYGHATSLDGSPTFWEKSRVWWLRSTHPRTMKGAFNQGFVRPGAVGLFVTKTIVTALFGAFFRPVLTILVVWWMLQNLPQLVTWMPKSVF